MLRISLYFLFLTAVAGMGFWRSLIFPYNLHNFAMTLILQDDHLTTKAWAACFMQKFCMKRRLYRDFWLREIWVRTPALKVSTCKTNMAPQYDRSLTQYSFYVMEAVIFSNCTRNIHRPYTPEKKRSIKQKTPWERLLKRDGIESLRMLR